MTANIPHRVTAVFNARIYVERDHFVEALLVEDGRIAAIGTTDDILAAAPEGAELFDAQGRCVVPGFNDSHLHLMSVGQDLVDIRLANVKSIAECERIVREYLERRAPAAGTVLHGRGWNQDYFEDESRLLTRDDLDAWCPDYPLILQRACGHILVANTAAIELAGITPSTPAKEGGAIDVDENGRLTGIFRENAMDQILCLMSEPTVERKAEILRAAMDYAASCGITSVQTMDVRPRDWRSTLEAYERVTNENPTLRIYHQCCFMDPQGYREFLDAGHVTGTGTAFNRMGPLKVFIDGSLGARTALMRTPYNDDPSTTGIATLTPEELDVLVGMAVENGSQVAVHAIGDGAIDRVLTCYEGYCENGENPNRLSVVHVQITDRPLLERFAKSDILAQVQPIFLTYDMTVVEDRVGAQMASTSYAFKTLADLGVHMSFGTDSPVEDMNVMDNLFCAVTRRSTQAPDRIFNAAEAVSIEEAVDAYTTQSAYTSFEENVKGRLMPGFYADLAVLNENIFEIDPMRLREVKVDATMVDGRWVYRRDAA